MIRPFPVLLLVALATPAAAHPLPNLRFDRTVHVRLAADAVTVRYALELNDWTMVLDGKDLVNPAEVKPPGGQMAYARKYAEKKAALLADDLRATLDGEPLTFRADKVEVEPERDHLRFRFLLRADWKPAPGRRHAFAFTDDNFEGKSGAVTLTLDSSGTGLTLDDVEEPVDLRGKSPLELKPGDEVRLRKASATFDVSPPTSPGVQPPGLPTAEDRGAKPPGSLEVTVEGNQPTGVAALADRGLAALFDTGYGLGVMLLLAFGFGAAHAFTPGHGKTLVAAYLVGERGTITHALVLGVVTTVAHTGSVILVAAILRAYYGETVPATTAAVLQVVGGLLIAAVGLWLFLQRVRGRADHVHLFGDHHHHHGDGHHHHHHGEHCDHVHPEAARNGFGWARVILLGLGGGIVPCWDAVLLLLVSISSGRLGAAVPLLLAFSVGLAAVLVALGVAVVLAHRAGGSRFGESRWFRALPVVSAALLIGLGLWFARDGSRTLFAESGPRADAPAGK